MADRYRGTSRAVWSTAVAISVLSIVLATRTTITSVEWIGRVFPGFVLLDNRVVASVGMASWTGAGVPRLHWSELLSVQGEAIRTAGEAYAKVAALPEGLAVDYVLRDSRGEYSLSVPTLRFRRADWGLFFAPFLINGLLTIACGVAVWVLGPRREVSLAFLTLGGTNGLFFLTTADFYGPGTFSWLTSTAEALLIGAVFQLALLFPQRSPYSGWRFAGYLLSAPLAWLKLTFFREPAVYVQLVRWNYVCVGLAVLILLVRLVSVYWRETTPLVRQRVRLVSFGAAVGIVLPGMILAVTVLTGGQTLSNVGSFTPFLFAVSIAYAIIQQDLFEIDAMVKRGAYYLALTGVVAATYIAAVLTFHQLLRAGIISDSPAFPVVFTLAVLLFLNPLRTRLQTLVDRVFFGARYNGAQVLASAGAELASALTREEITRLVRDSVEAAIANGHTQLLEKVPAALQTWLSKGRVASIADSAQLYPDAETHEAVRRSLGEMGAEVAVPMQRHGELVGMLSVGPKQTGLFYTASDIELLRALAQGAAIALQNAHSYEALTELNADLEARVRQRTAQLVQAERLASLGRLVAGVAHEINNPVSFVASAVAPLKERLAEVAAAAPVEVQAPLRDARELVDIMERGAERTAAIVRDLRSFSRADEEARQPIDLHEGLEVSLRLLESQWRERITIHRDYGSLPLLECAPGQMNQVFMNLLSNACDAIRGAGNLWVQTAQEAGCLRISIRDDGCGIAPDVVARIFDPFFTTKEIGHGTGLGLAISHSIVAAHGGRIEVETALGTGSTFHIKLPVDRKTQLDSAA